MATTLPKLIVMKSFYHTDKGYAHYKTGGAVALGEASLFSTLVKIEVEVAAYNRYVHLRFCYSNRYWQRIADGNFIVAQLNQPDEDTSKPSCTLFEPIKVSDDGVYYFIHVQSGGRLRIDDQTLAFYVDTNPKTEDGYLSVVNWETIVKLPAQVAFKGDNGKYLKAIFNFDNNYLQYSSDDPNHKQSGFQIQLNPDGKLLIKSDHTGKFWRLSPHWIWADKSPDAWDVNNPNTQFSPVKIDDNTIALRSVGGGRFCSRLSAEGSTNCLNSHVDSIVNAARIGVEELVMERKIYNVVYRMDDARIFDEKPYVAGQTKVTNRTHQEGYMTATIKYEEEKSYSFGRSLSLTAGVSTTIQAGVPFIAGGEITVTVEISGSFEWSNTTTTRESIEVSASVPVPAMSSVTVSYVGTKGTCNIPYSYTQQDKSSTDGTIVQTPMVDGIYNGVNCYNYQFKLDPALSL